MSSDKCGNVAARVRGIESKTNEQKNQPQGSSVNPTIAIKADNKRGFRAPPKPQYPPRAMASPKSNIEAAGSNYSSNHISEETREYHKPPPPYPQGPRSCNTLGPQIADNNMDRPQYQQNENGYQQTYMSSKYNQKSQSGGTEYLQQNTNPHHQTTQQSNTINNSPYSGAAPNTGSGQGGEFLQQNTNLHRHTPQQPNPINSAPYLGAVPNTGSIQGSEFLQQNMNPLYQTAQQSNSINHSPYSSALPNTGSGQGGEFLQQNTNLHHRTPQQPNPVNNSPYSGGVPNNGSGQGDMNEFFQQNTNTRYQTTQQSNPINNSPYSGGIPNKSSCQGGRNEFVQHNTNPHYPSPRQPNPINNSPYSGGVHNNGSGQGSGNEFFQQSTNPRYQTTQQPNPINNSPFSGGVPSIGSGQGCEFFQQSTNPHHHSPQQPNPINNFPYSSAVPNIGSGQGGRNEFGQQNTNPHYKTTEQSNPINNSPYSGGFPNIGSGVCFDDENGLNTSPANSSREASHIDGEDESKGNSQTLVQPSSSHIVICGLLALHGMLQSYNENIRNYVEESIILDGPMLSLKKNRRYLTHEGCTTIGVITTNLLNTRDAFNEANRAIREWCSLTTPLLKGLLRLVTSGNSSLRPQVAILNKVSTQALAKMEVVVSDFDQCVQLLSSTAQSMRLIRKKQLRDVQIATENSTNTSDQPIARRQNVNNQQQHISVSGRSTSYVSDDRRSRGSRGNSEVYRAEPQQAVVASYERGQELSIVKQEFRQLQDSMISIAEYFDMCSNTMKEHIKVLKNFRAMAQSVNIFEGLNKDELLVTVDNLMQACSHFVK